MIKNQAKQVNKTISFYQGLGLSVGQNYLFLALKQVKSKYWSTDGSWFYRLLLVLKSTICYFAWQVVYNL